MGIGTCWPQSFWLLFSEMAADRYNPTVDEDTNYIVDERRHI